MAEPDIAKLDRNLQFMDDLGMKVHEMQCRWHVHDGCCSMSVQGSNLGSLSPMFVKEEDLKLPKTAWIGIQVTPPHIAGCGQGAASTAGGPHSGTREELRQTSESTLSDDLCVLGVQLVRQVRNEHFAQVQKIVDSFKVRQCGPLHSKAAFGGPVPTACMPASLQGDPERINHPSIVRQHMSDRMRQALLCMIFVSLARILR